MFSHISLLKNIIHIKNAAVPGIIGHSPGKKYTKMTVKSRVFKIKNNNWERQYEKQSQYWLVIHLDILLKFLFWLGKLNLPISQHFFEFSSKL